MLQRFRLRKLFLYLSLLCVYDEIVIHTSRPIAPAIALVPVAYDAIILSAAAAGSLYSAYLVTQISDNVLRIHSQALPQVAQDLKEIFPTAPSHVPPSSDAIAQNLEESIGHASYKKAYRSQLTKSQEESLLHTINSTIIKPAISRSKHICATPSQRLSLAPYTPTTPSSPIHVSYQPNAVHFEIPHINTYGSISVTQEKPLSSVRRQIINDCHEFAVDEFLFKERCRHIPGYLTDFKNQLNEIILVFHELVSDDIYKRANACLIFSHMSIEGPYNYTLQNVIHELIPLYFDTEGKLEKLHPQNKVTRDFIIAKFLKNGITRSTYLELLENFNFKEVLRHEDGLGTYLWNSFCHITTGGWLPSISWYPHNIKTLIYNNNFNDGFEQILKFCKKHKFIEAEKIIKTAGIEVPVWQELYQECYQAFKNKYCDRYGILHEYVHDPLWANVSLDTKAEFSKNIEEITNFNSALAVRSIQKKSIEKAWGIAANAPDYVHNALYCLIDTLGTGPEFIDKVSELLEKLEGLEQDVLIDALYLPNGILKDFSHFTEIERYHFPKDIFKHQNLLNKVNKLFYLQHALAGTEEGDNAHAELDILQVAYDPTFLVKVRTAKALNNYSEKQNNSSFLANETSEPTPQNEPPAGEQIPLDENAPAPEGKPDKEEEVVVPEVIFEPNKPSTSGSTSATGNNLLDPSNGTLPPENEPEVYDIPRELPNDPEDWAKEIDGIKPWVPPSKNWKPEQAKAYLQFLGQGFLRTGLAAMGIPYEDFEYALEIFKNIPGFLSKNSTFQSIIRFCYDNPIKNWHQVKGFVYEIQTALGLNRNGQQIIEFGRQIPSGEIDIITTTRFIECKNVIWEISKKSIEKYKTDFGKQVKFIYDNWGQRLTVFSKEPLPQELKDWFIKKNIEYFEG